MTSARDKLLQITKRQYTPSSAPPGLCEVFIQAGVRLPRPRIAWISSAGLGGVAISMMSGPEAAAARALQSEGRLVPLWDDNLYGTTHYRPLANFDDVPWGYDQQRRIVIFDLARVEGVQDFVLTPGDRHRAALKLLQHRLQYGTAWEDPQPLRLSDGQWLRPILTDRHAIAVRRRQVSGLTIG